MTFTYCMCTKMIWNLKFPHAVVHLYAEESAGSKCTHIPLCSVQSSHVFWILGWKTRLKRRMDADGMCVCVYSRIGAFERELSSTVNEILTALGHAPETTDNNIQVPPSVSPTPLIVPWRHRRSVTWPHVSEQTWSPLNTQVEFSLCGRQLSSLPVNRLMNWQIADFAMHRSTYCFISLILHISLSRCQYVYYNIYVHILTNEPIIFTERRFAKCGICYGSTVLSFSHLNIILCQKCQKKTYRQTFLIVM